MVSDWKYTIVKHILLTHMKFDAFPYTVFGNTSNVESRSIFLEILSITSYRMYMRYYSDT